ncbi:pentatricopeptide repeat-containing protein At2g27610-like [Chenopodium quinoa]|uniref:pentatricopeptide repeat-containing protein At2g27610-like n=1 Tax=Chenopodium quinoa TaxID=63459 RepID=UPI000B777B1C|nr:pentatricopeptide repeat-containing protein At2g27610-like [Chenopodium quinoa]
MNNQKQWKLSSSILHDPKTLATVIQIYTKSKNLNAGKHLHAQIIRSVYRVCKYVNNYLLILYTKCGHLEYAQKVFDKMPKRNLVSWTALISALSQNTLCTQALQAFSQMRIAGESPNEFTFSSAVQATTLLKDVGFGRQIHCLSVKCGFSHELFVGSNLADMYSKCGVIRDGCKVFEEMPCKDEVSWTSMIHGYAKNGDFKEALLGFKTMLFEAMVIDSYTISCALSACGAMKAFTFGRLVHSMVVKSDFERDTAIGNALVDMYSKVGEMESALKVFKYNSWRVDIVSCTSLIDGYVEAGQVEEALEVFVEFRRQGLKPNEFTFSSLVKACANQAALEQGSMLHALAIKMNFAADPYVSSTLVFMYGKCGLVEHSERLFNCIKNPTEFAWNSLLGGFSQHGFGRKVNKAFKRMVRRGMKPNAITFMILLTGCSHSGLVDKGLGYFKAMERDYGVTPTAEHYSCIIDLLSRAGKLKEADDFISQMPFEPNAFGWSSYLGACRIQGDKARAKIAAEKLMRLEPENSSTHILLSSVYAKERQWEDVRNLRKMIKDGNIRKVPGYSWIDVGNKTHVFGAHEWSHPQQREIYNKLDSLIEEIKKVGYKPQTEVVDIDIDDDTKEKILKNHSEKLAVAFALMTMPSWKPIIIKKNLRICLDCHTAFKLIARVTRRRIIVRDSNRFHHFSNGSCSCGNFW